MTGNKIFAQYNIKAFPYTGSREVNYMANKKLVKPADYKGTTFRASGREQVRIVEFSGKPITMPSLDVYSALQTSKGINLVYLSPKQQMNWRNAMLKTGANIYCTADKEFKQNWEEAMKFQYMLDAYFDLQHPVYDRKLSREERETLGVCLGVGEEIKVKKC